MTKMRWVLAAWLAAATAACGGKVVVDGGNGDGNVGGGGQGGDGQGGSGAGGQGDGGFGQTCSSPPNPATLMVCGGSSGGGECTTSWCDPEGNIFEAACKATTCACRVNGFSECDCALNEPGNICAGTEHCCPWAKP